MSGSKALRKDRPSRMFSSLSLIDFSLSFEPADMRMVFTQLYERTLLFQIIETRIANVGEVDPSVPIPNQSQRRPHFSAIGVVLSEKQKFLVDTIE